MTWDLGPGTATIIIYFYVPDKFWNLVQGPIFCETDVHFSAWKVLAECYS